MKVRATISCVIELEFEPEGDLVFEDQAYDVLQGAMMGADQVQILTSDRPQIEVLKDE